MKKALIIVDVQNDFVEGGSLAVEGGIDLATRLSNAILEDNYLDNFDLIVTTQDWHINPGTHFSDNPDYVDSWPVHCVAVTNGANIVEPLRTTLENKVDYAVKKGMYNDDYSGFEGVTQDGQTLDKVFKDTEVSEVTVVGIATEYCVKMTSLHAIQRGYNVTIDSNFIAGINQENANDFLYRETTELSQQNPGTITVK